MYCAGVMNLVQIGCVTVLCRCDELGTDRVCDLVCCLSLLKSSGQSGVGHVSRCMKAV